MTVSTDLRLSQTKTLADLVAATLGVGRLSLAAIGRQLTGKTSAKHKIKRTWRFISNRHVIVSDAMRGVITRLCKRLKKPLIAALDWTDVRSFQTLMAAAVLTGRAVPLLWASYAKWELFKSRNALEEGLLHLLRTIIPEGVPVILLADWNAAHKSRRGRWFSPWLALGVDCMAFQPMGNEPAEEPITQGYLDGV
jgi:hypothetical protein